jgi:hypothetical protein
MSDATPTVDTPKPLRFRRTRVTTLISLYVATGVLALLCILMAILWYSSYSYHSSVMRAGYPEFDVASHGGLLIFTRDCTPFWKNNRVFWLTSWTHSPYTFPSVEFSWNFHDPTVNRIQVPHWMLVMSLATMALISGATAYLARLFWQNDLCARFSLRTMLIAATLVSVLLGLSAWLLR